MPTIDPFDQVYHCEKCQMIRTPEVRALRTWCDGDCEQGSGASPQEHLHVQCHGCGFKWLMACATTDAKE